MPLNYFDNNHEREKWEEEKQNLLENELNLLFAIRDLQDGD